MNNRKFDRDMNIHIINKFKTEGELIVDTEDFIYIMYLLHSNLGQRSFVVSPMGPYRIKIEYKY